MVETAIYTRDDGIVDWRYCRTRNPEADFEVPGTHIGMAFNPSAYAIVVGAIVRMNLVAHHLQYGSSIGL
jgi:hypothetical protein